MTSPKLSVIIPLNNLQDISNLTMRSLCEQTFTDFEIIILNAAYPFESKKTDPFTGNIVMNKITELIQEISENNSSIKLNKLSGSYTQGYNDNNERIIKESEDIFESNAILINKIIKYNKPRFGDDSTLLRNTIVSFAKKWIHEQKDVKDILSDKIRIIECPFYSLSHLKNIGIKEARGDYILFLPFSCCLDTEMFEIVIKAAEKDNIDILSFCYDISDFNGKMIKFRYRRYMDSFTATNHNEISSKLWELFTTNILDNCFNKIYNRNFLLENNIKFPKQTSAWADEKQFNYIAYKYADKISNIDKNLISKMIYFDIIAERSLIQTSFALEEIKAHKLLIELIIHYETLNDKKIFLDKWLVENLYQAILLPANIKMFSHFGEILRYFADILANDDFTEVLLDNEYKEYLCVYMVDFLRMNIGYYDYATTGKDLDTLGFTYSQFQKQPAMYWYLYFNLVFKDIADNKELFYNLLVGNAYNFINMYSDKESLNRIKDYYVRAINHADNKVKLGLSFYNQFLNSNDLQ